MARIKLVEGLTPEWFTPPSVDGNGEEESAEFLLQPLTQPQMLQCMRYYVVEEQRVLPEGLYLAAKLSVKDWCNVEDEDGDTAFKRAKIDSLPFEVIAEIGSRVFELSTLKGEELKN